MKEKLELHAIKMNDGLNVTDKRKFDREKEDRQAMRKDKIHFE